jgi:hypothetical protein
MRAIALLTIVCLSIKGIACGPGYYEDNEYLNLFKQELLSDSSLFLLLYDPYNSTYYSKASSKYHDQLKDPNLTEWQSYLGKIDYGALNWLVYHAPLDTVCALENQLLEKRKLPKILKRLSKKRSNGFLSYLAYAKRCEKEAIIITNWYEKAPREVHLANMKALIKEGEQLLQSTDKPFLKMRYLYQLVRLCHYSQNYDAALSYFNEASALDLKNYIYYRTMEQAGGAYTTLQPNKASYYFAKVFNALPDRKDVCLASFKVSSNEDWEEAITYCKNEEEKAAFYMLRAMTWSGNEREEFKSIQAFAPSSIYLDVLMMRLVNQYLRMGFLGGRNTSEYLDTERLAMLEHANELEALCNQFVKDNPKEERAQLFKLSKAYFQVIAQKFDKAKQNLQDNTFTGAYALQKRVLELVVAVRELDKLDSVKENVLYEEAKVLAEEMSNPDIMEFYLDNATRLYFEQGEVAKSFLCQQKAWESRLLLKKSLLQSLKRFEEKPSKSSFEEELWQLKKWSRDESLDLFGTYYLQHDQLDSAVYYFDQISDTYKPKYLEYGQAFDNSIFSGVLDFPRFYEKFVHQSDSTHLKYFKETKTINKFQLARHMVNLKRQAADDSDKKKAIEANILLANAWNNMNSNEFHRHVLYFRYTHDSRFGFTSDEEGDLVLYDMFENHYYDDDSYYFYDDNIPYQYLMNAAELTTNKETLARINFAAMRTEVNEGGDLGEYDYKERKAYYLVHSNYAKTLIDEFGDTEYYKQAIKECSHLRLRAAQN